MIEAFENLIPAVPGPGRPWELVFQDQIIGCIGISFANIVPTFTLLQILGSQNQRFVEQFIE